MCSQSFAPTSAGPGIADLPCVAVTPINFAYSGLILATTAVERVARCQMPMKAANTAIETIAARRRREVVISHSPLFSLSPFLRGEGWGEGLLSANAMKVGLAESP